MITIIRTASIVPGKQAKALAWVHEVAAFGKALDGAETHISLPIGGNPNRLRFTTQCENLAAYETRMAKLTSHPKWSELAAGGPELFVSESNFLEIWRDV